MQQICIEHFANHHAKLYLYHVSVIYSAKLVEKEWEEYYWEIVKRVETRGNEKRLFVVEENRVMEI